MCKQSASLNQNQVGILLPVFFHAPTPCWCNTNTPTAAWEISKCTLTGLSSHLSHAVLLIVCGGFTTVNNKKDDAQAFFFFPLCLLVFVCLSTPIPVFSIMTSHAEKWGFLCYVCCTGSFVKM